MKGLWKENVSGWNSKNSRRKKTTRHHTLRDNGRAIIKRYDHKASKDNESIFYNDSNLIFISDDANSKIKTQVNICQVLEDDLEFEWKPQKKSKIAFLFNGVWFDYFSGCPLEYQIVKILVTLDVTSVEKTPLSEEIIHVENPTRTFSHHFYLGGTDYIYGKPLGQWKRATFYDNGQRRKYAQKFCNKMDRVRVRKFISNGDWNAELETHAFSKSIAWLIY